MDEDWIICLAVIKFRNPELWDKVQGVIQPPIPVQTGGKTLDSIVPEELSHLKLHRSLLIHLESVFQYQTDESLKGNIDIQKTFSDDVSESDVLKWFYPNYKLLVTILSMKKDHDDILRLFHCFQMFLISFGCFKSKNSDFTTEIMIMRFVKNELLTIREKPPKSIVRLIPSASSFHDYRRLSHMCTLHFDTVRQILNLQSQLGHSSLVNTAFKKICLILESLIHVLLAHSGPKKDGTISARSAFRNRYLNRSRNMSHKYTNALFAALNKGIGSKEEKKGSLRLVVMELLMLIDSVHWPGQHPKSSDAQFHRLNVQATILVTGDLDLIAKARLCHWPHWSMNSECK